jgi:nucleoside phosphorylase/CheY-like chemotaxis protein
VKVLLVDDDVSKARDVSRVLVSSGVPNEEAISHVTNSSDALRCMTDTQFDLMIIDLAIPTRKTEEPKMEGGKNLLRQVMASERYLRPDHIIGLTSYEEAYRDSKSDFDNGLWHIVTFDRSSNGWIEKISTRIQHIKAKQRAEALDIGYDFDVAIICALKTPEFDEVQKLDCNWKRLDIDSDPTEYWQGTANVEGGPDIRIVAACAPLMGMAIASAITSKMCLQFRPRVMMMTGICAGREGEISLGDLVIANPSWDYGSGKFISTDGVRTFSPSPIQSALSAMLRKSAGVICSDSEFLDEVRRKYPGTPPKTALQAQLAPMASGSAVRSDDEFFDELAENNRKVVAIDMEAYGVFAAAAEMPSPRSEVIVVKGVSDFANSDKNDTHQNYAAYASAAFALRLIVHHFSST